jgi:hypothetical protein
MWKREATKSTGKPSRGWEKIIKKWELIKSAGME